MRIVQIGPVPPPHGGVAMNMLAIHDLLLERGHESTLIDVTDRGAEPANSRVIKPRSALALAALLFRVRADIVHYHIGGHFSLKLALLTFLCGVLPGKRSVVTFHSGGYTRDNVNSAKPFPIRGIAFRSLDLLIGVNDEMERMFKAFGVDDERIRLIPPFELKRPDPSVALPPKLEEFVRRSRPLLLSVGALEPEYRNEFLIKSMPAVLDRFPDAGLLIVGSGSLSSVLLEHTRSNGTSDRVCFAGNVDHPVVLRLIDRADVLLRITDYDGDSIAVREALFLGTPVIASDNAYRPSGVYLVPAGLHTAFLVEKLVQMERLQFTGHSTSGSGDRNAEKVLQAYVELLAG